MVGASTVLAWYSISRVFGVVWYYLMLWLWAVALLALVALAWSIVVALSKGDAPAPASDRPPLRSAAMAVPLVLVALLSVRATVTAPDTVPSDNQLSVVLQALAGPTAEALEDGAGDATGRDGRYVVGFDDALHIGSQAYGLVTELERAGFDAGMEPAFGVPITQHRTLRPEEATARVELVTGTYLDDWRRVPGAVEVGPFDLRSPRSSRSWPTCGPRWRWSSSRRGWRSSSRTSTPTSSGPPSTSERRSRLRVKMDRMLKIGLPTSVFITPPTATRP